MLAAKLQIYSYTTVKIAIYLWDNNFDLSNIFKKIKIYFYYALYWVAKSFRWIGSLSCFIIFVKRAV